MVSYQKTSQIYILTLRSCRGSGKYTICEVIPTLIVEILHSRFIILFMCIYRVNAFLKVRYISYFSAIIMPTIPTKESLNTLLPFLQGGGNVGKLIREKDWSQTPLGNPETWHHSLRTMVSMMLNNPIGMYLMWGDDHIQLYNDAYRPILGQSKHPEALGISARKTFCETWGSLEPLIKRAMKGEPIRFPDFELELHRNGYLETCFFDFSYTPIFDDNGTVGGILATVFETSERKRAEAALKESNNQLAFAIEATELGTFDFNPATNTFSGNERLKAWFGLPPKSEIALQDAIDAVAEEDKDRVMEEIAKVLDYESGGNYCIVYTIVHPESANRRIVSAKGRAWFNENQQAIRFNGTLQDITSSEKNARQLEESERNLRLMVHQAPVAIGILMGEEFVIEIANSRALELWGHVEAEVLKKPILEAMPELLGQGINELLEQVYNTGKTFTAKEMPVDLPRDGKLSTTYINFSFEPLYNADGNIHGIMAIGIEVTDQVLARKKIERSERQVKNVVENAPFMIGLFTGENFTIQIANESLIQTWGKGDDVIGKDYFELLPELKEQKVFGQIKDVYSTGIPFHIENESVDFVIDGELKSQYYNYDFIPLRSETDEVYGIMISAINVTDLISAKIKIEESERRFRESVKQAPLGIAIFRGDEFITELVNETYLQMIKKPEAQVINRSLFDAMPELRETIEPLFHEVLNSGEPFHSAELPVVLNRNGAEELAYFNLVYHPLKESDGSISGIMVVAVEITESVYAKKDLQVSEEHFRTMVNQSPMGMAVLRGEDLIIEMANAKMLQGFWKKTPEEVIGKKILDVFPELMDQQFPKLFEQVLKKGKKIADNEVVALVKHSEGLTKFYIDFEYAPLIELGGAVSGIIITAVDVTTKVAARKQLENAEERIRLATESTELATWELFLDKKELIHSPRLAEIFGHSSEKRISHEKLLSQILKPDLGGVVKKAFRKALKNGVYKYEARVVKPDGSLTWIRTQGKVFYDSKSKPLKIIGTLRDITEEKQQQQALQESEEKFRALADALPQFIWTGDKDGSLNYFNNSVFDYSGLTEAELIGGGWINMVHPDERERNITTWKNSIETGADFIFEHRFLRHDGDYRWQLSRAIPQRDAAGNILMWVGASTDIQDMKEVDQQKDFFISMASHELKTPITSIKGYVQIMQSMYVDNGDDFLNNSLNIIDKQVVTLTNLISDLLDLSKIKSGSLILVKSRFSVNTFMSDFVSEIRQINPGCIIHFKEIRDEYIFADRERLGQVLINLLTNAIKYSPLDCEVHVRNEYRNGNLIVSVRDGGIGISKKDQRKIFERFYRVEGKDEKTYPGFGIGLNIAAEIIERHGGEIGVKSEIGEGSEFHFIIPIQSN